jgi:hypothetical protein
VSVARRPSSVRPRSDARLAPAADGKRLVDHAVGLVPAALGESIVRYDLTNVAGRRLRGLSALHRRGTEPVETFGGPPTEEIVRAKCMGRPRRMQALVNRPSEWGVS